MKTKAITIRQPWASLIVKPSLRWMNKDIENRTRRTSHRGMLAIHAGKTLDESFEKNPAEFLEMLRVNFIGNSITEEKIWELPRGGIIGTAKLVDCVEFHESRWFTGPWGWVLQEQMERPFIECRGMPGLFEVDLWT